MSMSPYLLHYLHIRAFICDRTPFPVNEIISNWCQTLPISSYPFYTTPRLNKKGEQRMNQFQQTVHCKM